MLGLLCIPPLAVLVLSDLRSRRVGVLPLSLFGAILSGVSVVKYGFTDTLIHIGLNLSVCLILWGCLLLYARLRKMQLSHLLGFGDMVFVLLLTPYFEPREFVLYLTFSCLCTLCAWGVYRLLGGRRRSIPLVSGLALCFLLTI